MKKVFIPFIIAIIIGIAILVYGGLSNALTGSPLTLFLLGSLIALGSTGAIVVISYYLKEIPKRSLIFSLIGLAGMALWTIGRIEAYSPLFDWGSILLLTYTLALLAMEWAEGGWDLWDSIIILIGSLLLLHHLWNTITVDLNPLSYIMRIEITLPSDIRWWISVLSAFAMITFASIDLVYRFLKKENIPKRKFIFAMCCFAVISLIGTVMEAIYIEIMDIRAFIISSLTSLFLGFLLYKATPFLRNSLRGKVKFRV